jgi:hypothetical protein
MGTRKNCQGPLVGPVAPCALTNDIPHSGLPEGIGSPGARVIFRMLCNTIKIAYANP